MSRRVAAIAPDLFFAARIAQTATLLGVELEVVAPDRALERCRTRPPDLVLVDLEAVDVSTGLLRRIKADPGLASVPVIGFCSHVDAALRASARAAGADQVWARSAFTRHLAEILSGRPLPRADQRC
ncbi:MAG TPA: hypothetical protein VGK93_10635 [Candidatus Eisenbacteria bacterium]|jgi:CheY-like chemotaxis protein